MSEATETEQYYRERQVIQEAMRILGKRTSERKKASSRANAKRPRKKRAKNKDILRQEVNFNAKATSTTYT